MKVSKNTKAKLPLIFDCITKRKVSSKKNNNIIKIRIEKSKQGLISEVEEYFKNISTLQ